MIRFVVVDLSHTKSVADIAAYALAQQQQLREDFAPAWDNLGSDDVVLPGPSVAMGATAAATLANVAAAIAADEWPILIWPHVPAGGPDGALGVHDRLTDGRPVMNVYADLCTKYGDAWQSVASHEVLEARADPRLCLCVELNDGSIWDREICDRVEADTYARNGVPLSNFNTPACFEPWRTAFASATSVVVKPPHVPSVPHSPPPPPPAHERYDFMGKSTKPNEVRPGGYAQRFDPSQGWTQVGQMRGYREALTASGLTRHARIRKARNAGARPHTHTVSNVECTY